jgi:Type II secretion system (T2SS), protein N
MPTSPSPRRDAKKVAPAARAAPSARAAPGARAAPTFSFWPYLALIIVLAVLAVGLTALPASLITHFVPASVHAEDFSGSLWHGSAGKISLNARDAGALEWRLHPAALLHLAIAADVHWVSGGFVLDGAVHYDRSGLEASNIQGGGPIQDLRNFGLGNGWRGTAKVQIKQLKLTLSGAVAAVQSVAGDIAVSDLAAPELAQGADLGGYALHFPDAAIGPDSEATAELNDTGGPIGVQAVIRYSGKERRGTLTGTIQERADTPAVLRSQLENLAQLHPRDAHGRIPVDLEFTL